MTSTGKIALQNALNAYYKTLGQTGNANWQFEDPLFTNLQNGDTVTGFQIDGGVLYASVLEPDEMTQEDVTPYKVDPSMLEIGEQLNFVNGLDNYFGDKNV